MGPRVVSLVPSVTETLAALGADPIACTRFCERPDLPVVGGTKNPDVTAIVALRPDHVVMNDEENRREDFDALRAAGIDVVEVSPRTVAAVGPVVRTLAELVGRDVPELFGRWESWLDARATMVSAHTAVTFVWRRPWMGLGRDTYGSSVLECLGIANALSGSDRYPEIALDDAVALRPDVLILPSEPYAFSERHRDEVSRAAPRVRVVLVDGRDLFWWGTRTPDALTRLAGQLG